MCMSQHVFAMPQNYPTNDTELVPVMIGGEISPRELFVLQDAVGWDTGLGRTTQGLKKCDIAVGIREPREGSLVAFGAVYESDGVTYLADLSVSPGFQGRGLGKFVVDERVRRVREAGASSVTAYVEDSSRLRGYYPRLGFVVASRLIAFDATEYVLDF